LKKRGDLQVLIIAMQVLLFARQNWITNAFVV